jgi:integrase
MRWADIDDDWWTVTTAKNGMNHRVPLSPQTLQVLRGAPRRGETCWKRVLLPESA